MRAHAEIVSGAYKYDSVYKMLNGKEVELDEFELLTRKVAEMNRHINLMQEIAEKNV